MQVDENESFDEDAFAAIQTKADWNRQFSAKIPDKKPVDKYEESVAGKLEDLKSNLTTNTNV